ncbi:hypothetical protein MKZ38_006009 [Zalerion maritima]|uniref:Uncharacterized protein n=1 Tax=Zalerion maritima TaxID=339359 RepID=A0AAD5RK05_9PEZI|nr:hypothetical protein MKZ38_006009 [Zalerion maritima]
MFSAAHPPGRPRQPAPQRMRSLQNDGPVASFQPPGPVNTDQDASPRLLDVGDVMSIPEAVPELKTLFPDGFLGGESGRRLKTPHAPSPLAL